MDEPDEQQRLSRDQDPLTDDEQELDMDVRSVAVIWREDTTIEVSFDSCSAFEAIGLLRVALRKLESEFALDEEGDDE